MSDEGLLGGKAEPARGGTAGDDEGAGLELSLPRLSANGCCVRSAALRRAEAEFCAEAWACLSHVPDELGALDAIGPAGEVFDHGSEGELAAGLVAFEYSGVRLARAV